MDAQVFSVFAQELVKEAVTVDDLYRGVSSAKNVDLNPGWLAKSMTRLGIGSSASSKPTSRQWISIMEGSPKVDELRISVNQLRDQLSASPSKAVRDQAKFLRDPDPRWLYSKIPKFFRSKAGEIKIDPERINTNVSILAGKPKLQTPEAKKAVTAMVASHELAERRVHPRDIREFSTHLAPEVLLKERNALARLEGPGAREAADTMAAFRERSGEAQYMRNLLTHAYGPRAAQFLEGDQKVPKAMIRNLRRRLWAREIKLYELPKIQELTGRASS